MRVLFQYARITGKDFPEDKKIANLLILVASKIKPATEKYIPLLVEYIVAGKIDSEVRVTGEFIGQRIVSRIYS